jgi:hypothetical protein
VYAMMTYTCGHILRNNKLNERKSAGGIVTAQSTAEDSLKTVEKKADTCRDFILTNTFLTFYWF